MQQLISLSPVACARDEASPVPVKQFDPDLPCSHLIASDRSDSNSSAHCNSRIHQQPQSAAVRLHWHRFLYMRKRTLAQNSEIACFRVRVRKLWILFLALRLDCSHMAIIPLRNPLPSTEASSGWVTLSGSPRQIIPA